MILRGNTIHSSDCSEVILLLKLLYNKLIINVLCYNFFIKLFYHFKFNCMVSVHRKMNPYNIVLLF